MYGRGGGDAGVLHSEQEGLVSKMMCDIIHRESPNKKSPIIIV